MKKVLQFSKVFLVLIFTLFSFSCTDEEPVIKENNILLVNDLSNPIIEGEWILIESYLKIDTIITPIDTTPPVKEEDINEYSTIYQSLIYKNNYCEVKSKAYYWDPISSKAIEVNEDIIYFYQLLDNTITWDDDQIAIIELKDNTLTLKTDIKYTSSSPSIVYRIYTRK